MKSIVQLPISSLHLNKQAQQTKFGSVISTMSTISELNTYMLSNFNQTHVETKSYQEVIEYLREIIGERTYVYNRIINKHISSKMIKSVGGGGSGSGGSGDIDDDHVKYKRTYIRLIYEYLKVLHNFHKINSNVALSQSLNSTSLSRLNSTSSNPIGWSNTWFGGLSTNSH